jgi:ABC-type amino acid transport substrate-binding protein
MAVAALVAVFAMLATACGGEEGGGETTTPPASPTGSESQTATTPAPTFTTLKEGVLTIGDDIPYPPFEYREGGTEVGFDIDLINEIATRLGVTTEIIDTDFGTIFTQLATGRFDLVIAAATITPEREKEVDFSNPYFNAQQSLTVNTGERPDITSWQDLGEGDVVGVQKRTTGEMWALDNLPDTVEIRSFPEGPDGYTALEAGVVDAVINDESTALAEVANRPGLELVETIPTGEAYGIAVNPANPELLTAVNEQLQAIVDDGTYEQIFAKYPTLPPGGNIAAFPPA